MITSISIFLLVITAFLLLAAIFFYARSKKKLNEVKRLLEEQQQEHSVHLLEEQENERNRIAQDLHDRLGSMLTIIKLSLNSIESKVLNLSKDQAMEEYEKINVLIDEACDEVRNISHDLSNGILTKFGLSAALKALVDSLKDENIEVRLQVNGIDYVLDNKISVNVYSIVQELVNNVLKHAKASEVSIQVTYFDKLLCIMVEDNGIGFNYGEVNSGIGLSNIRSRLYKLGGEMNIDSGKGSGTTIVINIPCSIVRNP